MQLWLEPGEEPVGELARSLFADPHAHDTPGLPFTYTASLPTLDPRHPDTDPPTRLRRARPAFDPQHDSVQYDGDVTITTDLGKALAPRSVEVVAFTRHGDFEVRDVRVALSPNGDAWDDLGTFKCETQGGRAAASIAIERQTRYVRLHFRRAQGAGRILLGSIKFLPSEPLGRTEVLTHVRPLHAKNTLENALQAAGVPFLFGCYPTELLVDGTGAPAGLVMANRMGRQAVRAKVVIDATEHAVLARLAGADFAKPVTASAPVRWVAIGSEPVTGDGIAARRLPFPVRVFDLTARKRAGRESAWFEYTMITDRPADNWPARALWEQNLRDRICVPTQMFVADTPLAPPVRSIVGRSAGAAGTTLNACRPNNVDRLWLLGPAADLPPDQFAQAMRPVALMQLGERVGTAAADEARKADVSGDVRVADRRPDGPVYSGKIDEYLGGLRSSRNGVAVADSASPLPVLGTYDIVVVGGGTSGAPAGIGAARRGARTLVLEAMSDLGGVATLGMIGKYWYGNRVGFSATVPQNPLEVRTEFYRRELRNAGGDVWFGVIGCGVTKEGSRVTGVVVATPYGRGVVRANVVIDGTGNADVAAVAGAETQFVEEFFALQQSHIPPREVGASYINGNRTPIDAADPVDVTAAMTSFKNNAFDRGQLVASRERRRIVGDYCIDWLDQINRRTFPDTIALGQSDYDSHGYQVHPYFMLKPARVPDDHRRQFYSYVPYRCLLPRGLNGILVVGLGLSAHRDAMPIVRMQPDLQNIGYAAGVAAAMCAERGLLPRQIDVKALQGHLVEVGAIEKDVPNHADSGVAPDDVLEAAASSVGTDYEGLGIVLANRDRALPRLRAAFDASTGSARLAYAHVLGVLNDAHGVDALIAEARRRLAEGDLAARKGVDGMDPVVQLIWALGRTGQSDVVPVLCELAEKSGSATHERLRAVVVSLGRLRDPRAAGVLTRFLAERGMSDTGDAAIVACALYRCGDSDGAARRVLDRMAAGTNGPLARLASQVLSEDAGQ